MELQDLRLDHAILENPVRNKHTASHLPSSWGMRRGCIGSIQGSIGFVFRESYRPHTALHLC